MSDMLLDDVKKQVVEYLGKHGHALIGDIIFELGIDTDLVIEALYSLEEENKVENRGPQE